MTPTLVSSSSAQNIDLSQLGRDIRESLFEVQSFAKTTALGTRILFFGNTAVSGVGNTKPEVTTDVYVTYDDTRLYVAYVCHDDPGSIRAAASS